MAKVPSLPSNGQPIDTQYIYDIVNSLISINSELNTSGTSNVKRYTEIYPVSKTSSLNIDAQTVNAVNAEQVKKSISKTLQASFATTFTQIPVVTITPQTRGSSTVNASIIITSVDKTGVNYKVIYDGDGSITLDVNIIAIGK